MLVYQRVSVFQRFDSFSGSGEARKSIGIWHLTTSNSKQFPQRKHFFGIEDFMGNLTQVAYLIPSDIHKLVV